MVGWFRVFVVLEDRSVLLCEGKRGYREWVAARVAVGFVVCSNSGHCKLMLVVSHAATHAQTHY